MSDIKDNDLETLKEIEEFQDFLIEKAKKRKEKVDFIREKTKEDYSKKTNETINSMYDYLKKQDEIKISNENKKNVLSIRKDLQYKRQNESLEEKYKRRLQNLWRLDSEQLRKYYDNSTDEEIEKILDSEVIRNSGRHGGIYEK